MTVVTVIKLGLQQRLFSSTIGLITDLGMIIVETDFNLSGFLFKIGTEEMFIKIILKILYCQDCKLESASTLGKIPPTTTVYLYFSALLGLFGLTACSLKAKSVVSMFNIWKYYRYELKKLFWLMIIYLSLDSN